MHVPKRRQKWFVAANLPGLQGPDPTQLRLLFLDNSEERNKVILQHAYHRGHTHLPLHATDLLSLFSFSCRTLALIIQSTPPLHRQPAAPDFLDNDTGGGGGDLPCSNFSLFPIPASIDSRCRPGVSSCSLQPIHIEVVSTDKAPQNQSGQSVGPLQLHSTLLHTYAV